MSNDAELTFEPPCCIPPPPLPDDLLIAAAAEAVTEHPPNAPPQGAMSAFVELISETGQQEIPVPLRIALMTNMYWGPQPRTLSVSFMETASQALATKIVGHMNGWACGIKFALTNGAGDVRISREGGGYWSYLGISIKQIPKNQPTMNLQGFTLSTPDSEFFRVVRHETGHTLGCPHEHMRGDLVARIDRQKAYAYFRQTQGWSKAEVDQQVLTPLNEQSLMSTPADQTSIMCYQLPRSITVDGQPILGGADINATDRAFILGRYPTGVVTPTPTPVPTPTPTGTPPAVITTTTPPSTGDQITVNGQKYLVTTQTTTTLTPR